MAGIPNNIVSILAVDNAGATTVIDVATLINSVQPVTTSASTQNSAQVSTQRQTTPSTSYNTSVVNNETITTLAITADYNFIPKINQTKDNLVNSLIYEMGGKIGINNKFPKYQLDVSKGSINITPLVTTDGYKIGESNIAYADLTVATKEAIVMGDDTNLKRVNINTLLLRGLIPTSPLGSKRMVAIDDYGVVGIAVAGVDYQDVIGYVPANAATTITINGVSYDLYTNRTWSVGTVTAVAALTITASGTDVTSTVLTPTTTPAITLNIPSASATNRGVLTSADWTTFNNKQAALSGTGFVKSTAGTISYDTNTYYLASNPSNYISGNQSITLSGDISGTGTTAITTSLSTITQTSTGNFVKITLDTKGRVTGNTAVLASDITSALTYTPVTNARTLTINGVTYDLTANRSWTIDIGSSARNIIKFTATAGQTTFTITGGYSVGLIDVYLNGARLSSTDYTASNGTTVVLASGVVAGDIVETVSYTSYAASSISGAGTTGYITKWTGSSAQGNSIIQDSGTAITIGGNATATSFIKSGGTSAQFLKADGSVDSTAYTPSSRTLTINGTAYDLTADRSWTITSMIYPAAGIAVSTGTAWGTSITDNSANWNTAYGWGNHASAGYLTSITSTQVTNALGYTPYNSTNPSGYITSSGSISGNAATATNSTQWNGAIFNGTTTRFNGDLNTLGLSGTSGVYNLGGTLTNNPANYGTLYGFWNSDISTQLYISYTGSAYWRPSVGTTFSGSSWKTFLDSSNYTSYSPSLTGTGASGTWGISISGNAASASSVTWANVSSKPSSWLNAANLIESNAPNSAVPSGFWQDIGGAGNPTGTWFNYINVRHSNTGNVHGYQAGMSYYDNNFYVRSYQGSGTYQSWNRLLGTNTDTYPSNMDQYVRTSDTVQFGGIRTGGSYTGYHASFKPITNVTFNIGQSTGNIGVAGPFLNATKNGVSDTTSVPMFFNADTYNWFCNYDQKMKLESTYGDLFLRGYIYQGNTNWSDLRMKQNLKKIEDPLTKIKSINGYTFEWREWTGYRNTPEILERINDAGLIAQEVKEVLPEIVENDIRRDQLSLNYNGIIALHTEGMKKLIEDNEELRRRIEELESKLL